MNFSRHKIRLDKKQQALFLRFIKLLLPYREKWAAIIFLSGFGALLGLINPYLTKLVVDKAIGNKDLKTFVILVIIGGAVFIVIGIINGFGQYLERYVKLRIKFDLNKKVFKKIEILPLSWFQNKSTGEHLYKIDHDISRVKDLVATTLPRAIALFPKLVLILIIISHLNWRIAVLAFFLTPFLYLPSYYFINKRRKVWERLIGNSQNIFKSIQELFSHIPLIKVFNKENVETKKYLRQLMDNIKIELSSVRLDIFGAFAANAGSKIIIGLISFYGGYMVIRGEMSLGSLAAILVYLGQLVAMQNSFVGFFQTAVLGLISCQRVAAILDEEGMVIEDKGARNIVFSQGNIQFKNVSFGYMPGKPILKDLSFSIEGNKHIGFFAPSGAGKTTLLNLIVRLYDPWQGEILIDGVNIKDMKMGSLKEQIGMALQEPFLFNDTVANNIAYGKKNASRAEICEAARHSLADDFINNLPDGYETVIGENACKISEGQKQRIAIARAIIKRPRILILDEAMSSVDSASEEKILLNIKQLLGEISLITVSHRSSTLMAVDRVYSLEASNIHQKSAA
ncbi:MAG: ABC transporter ATP-binding protein [Candidatus Gorgyraea atricola]|nr:ABC transporter ATP-binding protein [Candidatus Gorgyraea atricola]